MTKTDYRIFFNGLEILEEKCLGKKLGILRVNSRDYPLYEKRVNLVKQLNSGAYGVVISKDIYHIIKDNKFIENKMEDGIEMVYSGFNKNKAVDFFNKIIEDDKNEKLKNLIRKIFSEN